MKGLNNNSFYEIFHTHIDLSLSVPSGLSLMLEKKKKEINFMTKILDDIKEIFYEISQTQ